VFSQKCLSHGHFWRVASTYDRYRSESGGQPGVSHAPLASAASFWRAPLSRPRARLVAWARAYVGFVHANVAEYDITEVCHRSRSRPAIRCPILA
jgi:hypothetical protein